MKSNGIEYKIYKNGTGKLFKVLVKSPGFMGFEQWKPLMKEWWAGCVGEAHWYTTTPDESEYKNCRTLIGGRKYSSCLAVFDSCKQAKDAAIEYSKQHLKDQWEECRC